MTYRIELYKENTIWNYMVYNPKGGSFGSCNRGTKARAIELAMMFIPAGAQVEIVTL